MDTLFHDVRYAARKLLRTPGFTIIAVLTLTLGIGATTAIFSVVNAVLLEPLPFREPDRLVRFGSVRPQAEAVGTLSAMSIANFQDLRTRTRSFEAAAAINIVTRNLTASGGEPARLRAARVSANWFDLLGTRPTVGRGFAPGDEVVGAAPVAVLSDALWRSRFGSDPKIVGRTVPLDGRAVTVVGIAPRAVNYPTGIEVWLPLAPEAWELDPRNRGANYLTAVARLSPGATAASATRELEAHAKELAAQYPESNTNLSAGARSLQEFLVADVEKTLYVMLGAVAFVLLIACANVANLLLVRAAGRESEIAVRAALGAGRGRIVRQLVTESLLLSATGAVLGVALAAWIVDAVVAFGPQGLPRLSEVAIDTRVLAFTAGIAALTGLVFGVAPALHATRPALAQMLREAGRGAGSRRGVARTRGLLVVSEMALAVVLLVGAGLLIRSFMTLVAVDPGFRSERLVSFDLGLPDDQYPYDREQRQFAAALLERMRALPGVQHAALTFGRPLASTRFRTIFDEVGQPPSTPENRRLIEVRPASQDYFATMGIPVLRGRGFSAEDRAGRPAAVVVNQEFVRRYYANGNPVGKRITLGWGRDTAAAAGPSDTTNSVIVGGEIVGVVGDVRQFGLDAEPYPITYFVYEQHPVADVTVLLRTTGDPRPLMAQVGARVREVDPKLPIVGLTTMEEAVSASVSQPRFYTVLLGAFAALALVLAAIGIYGVISYAVSMRTRELGIRLALGATRAGVVRLVVREGLAMTIGGVVVGVVASFWLTKLIASLLFGVGALDAWTFAAVPLVLIGVAAFASWVPARRAGRVDPVIAIRSE